MMLFMLLVIWALGLLVLFTDPKKTSIRWACATALIGGGGYFSAVIDEILLPYLQQTDRLQPFWEQVLMTISNTSSFITQAGLPYAYLMFAVYSGEAISRKTKKMTSFAAFLPPAITFVITPIYPALTINYGIVTVWAIPYFLAACLILLYDYRQEKDPLVKKSRFYTNILVIIPLFFIFFFIYGMRLFDLYEAWRYNSVVVAIQFFLIAVISVKYGFLGVRLRVEKRRLDSTLRAMTTGTQIVNHTIKNELGKASLYANRIESYAKETNQPELLEDIRVLTESTEHILSMMNRIQGQLQDVKLKEEWIDPALLIKQVLDSMKREAEKHRIGLKTELHPQVILYGDQVQVKEILTNLCMNAFEAMKTGGTLTIQMFPSKKHLVIAVADTGVGIPKESLPHVLDPFFSTKKTGTNFGLGLSYCYNVMQKHQGTLEIYSVQGEGTTVFLYFPQKRVKQEHSENKGD